MCDGRGRGNQDSDKGGSEDDIEGKYLRLSETEHWQAVTLTVFMAKMANAATNGVNFARLHK